LTYRLLAGVVEHVGGNVQRLALDLVGPATVVADASNDGANVAPGHGDGLAIVQRLDGGEELGVLLGKISELEDQAGSVARGGGSPCCVEGLAGGGHGQIDVLLGTFADGGDDLLGGGVDDLELFLVDTLNKLVVDEAVEWRLLVACWCRYRRVNQRIIKRRDSQANGLGVGARDGGVELDGQSHGEGCIGMMRRRIEEREREGKGREDGRQEDNEGKRRSKKLGEGQEGYL
jgi:hypothetical protein